MAYFLFALFFIVFYVGSVFSANILFIASIASPSHHIWSRTLMNGLAEKGHNVTGLSAFVDKKHPDNLNYIYLDQSYNEAYGDEGGHDLDLVSMAQSSIFEMIELFYGFGDITCEGAFKSEGMKTILNYPDDFKFDLVINDFTCGPCLLGLLHKFKYPPLVSVTAFSNPPYTNDLIGGHKHYSYVPFYALDYDVDMTFKQRLTNAFIYTYDAYYRNYIAIPKMDKMMREYYKFDDMPYAAELDQKTLIMMVNAHYSIDFPEEVPPNLIQVAGIQIKDAQPLPEDLEAFVQSAKKGAVLFSLGTNVRSDQLDKERQKMFIDAFRQLPDYHFMWKFESDLDIPLPKNVIIRKWLPQNDILGHPKTKGFITHGGLLSTQESTWHGVPMVGIPFICDQYRNLQKSINAGVAEKLDFATLSMAAVRDTLMKVLENPSYKQNINKRSALFRDQPEKPLDRAIWWVEWALRNPKATQLRSPTLNIGRFIANSYDILLFLLVVIVTVLVILAKIAKIICAKLKENSQKVKKN